MALRINIEATLQVYQNLVSAVTRSGKILEKMASGMRINRAAEDAAGFAVANQLNTQILGLQTATDNTLNAYSMMQVGSGALNEVSDNLQRMRELAVKASDGSLSDADRAQIQKEMEQLENQIQQIGNTTQFNEKNFLQGEVTKVVKEKLEGGTADSPGTDSYTFQVGANSSETVSIGFAKETTYSGTTPLDVSTREGAEQAISRIDNAISYVSSLQSNIGSFQNRLGSVVRNNQVAIENQMSAKSRIEDMDMALSVIEMMKSQTQTQTGIAALKQVNISSQQVLSLFQ